MNDNKTEHLRTINIINRFNIYQEVILAALYRILNLEVYSQYQSSFLYNLTATILDYGNIRLLNPPESPPAVNQVSVLYSKPLETKNVYRRNCKLILFRKQ